MPKKTKSIKNKSKVKKNKLLIFISIITILLIILGIITYSLSKNQKNKPEIKKELSDTIQPKITGSWEVTSIPTPPSLSIPKNATPLFEISTDSEDKNTIWNFIKKNYETQDTVYKNGKSFFPFIVKNDKSKFKVNLTGFDTEVADIQSGSKRLIIAKQIENLIISLGYKQIKTGDKTDSFELVENMGNINFLKGDQIFSVYYQQGNCEEVDYGGCYIRVSYFNNIEKQISSQLEILNKLTDTGTGVFDKKDGFSYIENGYVISDPGLSGVKIGDYIIFNIGRYNSDFFTILAKINKENNYKTIIDGDYSKEINYDLLNLPDDVLCTYFSVKGNVFMKDDLYIIKNCKQFFSTKR